jgi:RNAse (barnase) inhibitor barstar
MAPFRNEPEEWQRLDWRILQNGAVSLYYRREILEADAAWFKSERYVIYELDCAPWQTLDLLHDSISSVLAFPNYYGRNLDALHDCLSDLEIPDVSGAVLMFLHFDQLVRRFPKVAQALLDIIETNSRRFLLTGHRLIALVQSDDPTIQFDPVGARLVSWNGAEWLSIQRLPQ